MSNDSEKKFSEPVGNVSELSELTARKFSVKTIVAIGIGAALFFVLGRFVAIPSPIPNVTISIQYGLLAFMATLFGPVAGCLIGLIGHFFIDLSAGWGVWWSWVITSGIFGALVGLGTKKTRLSAGLFGKPDTIAFVLSVCIGHLICWALIAPVLDILIYQEPADKVFIQGLVSAAANIVTTLIVGYILCFVYAKSKPQAGSLKKED